MLKVFCSYSHRDRELKENLEEHLAVLIDAGKITVFWSDDQITAGTEFDVRLRAEMEESKVVLLLLSSSYFKSAYCWRVEGSVGVRAS